MEINQYAVYLINLDPTIGHEIKKTRPCVVISPDEMNRHLQTVMIAPMTTKSHNFPSRISLSFANHKAWIVLDQIRTIDRQRLIKCLGKLEARTATKIKQIIKEMLVE